MSWMFGLFRLALSLGFFSCFDDITRLDRPLARAEADCACPIQTVGYQCPTPGCDLQRLGVDSNAAAENRGEYTVEVRQTGKRDCTLSWPKVTLMPKQRAMVSVSGDGKSWLMSLHLREVVGEKAFVEVGLTGRGPGGDVVNYKGAFDPKIGACNLTAMGGKGQPEPLAVSICVKKAEWATASLPMPRPAPLPPVGTFVRSWPAPTIPAPMPVAPSFPVYTHPVPQAAYTQAVQPCLAYTAAVPATKVVTLMKDGGKSKLSMKTVGLTTTGTKMTIDTPGVGQVKVAAGKKSVHVKGNDFTATADKVEVCGSEVKLCGHVKLTCEKIGVGAEVKAECLAVKVHNGSFVEFVKCVCPAACCPATVTPNRAN